MKRSKTALTFASVMMIGSMFGISGCTEPSDPAAEAEAASAAASGLEAYSDHHAEPSLYASPDSRDDMLVYDIDELEALLYDIDEAMQFNELLRSELNEVSGAEQPGNPEYTDMQNTLDGLVKQSDELQTMADELSNMDPSDQDYETKLENAQNELSELQEAQGKLYNAIERLSSRSEYGE